MKKTQFTPATLRLILSIGLVLAIVGAGVIFTLASTQLRNVATTVSHKVADAKASQNNLANLKKIEKFLADNKEAVTRANDIVAESKSYEYQNQIINDLKTYAAASGVSIKSFDFSAGNSATPTTAAPAATGAATTPSESPAATPAAPTLKSTTVSITLDSPLVYNNLLHFVKAIEQNLTKMQISAITLSKGAGNNQVTTDALSIEVYIR
jgi:hypothetical protein